MTDRTNLPASPAASGDDNVYPYRGYKGPKLIDGLSPAALAEVRAMDEWREPNNSARSDDDQFCLNIDNMTDEQLRVASGLPRNL